MVAARARYRRLAQRVVLSFPLSERAAVEGAGEDGQSVDKVEMIPERESGNAQVLSALLVASSVREAPGLSNTNNTIPHWTSMPAQLQKCAESNGARTRLITSKMFTPSPL